jgi:hypothetical protein
LTNAFDGEEEPTQHITNNIKESPSNTDWNDIANKSLLTGAGLGVAGLISKNVNGIKDVSSGAAKVATNTINAADKINTSMGQATQGGINTAVSAINRGVDSTKKWVASEKRKENPTPIGVDTGMTHGPQKRNNTFYKKVKPLHRNLNEPTSVAKDVSLNSLSQPGDIKRKKPLTGPAIVPQRVINKRKILIN